MDSILDSIIDLQGAMKDKLDNSNAPQGRELLQMTQQLRDEAEGKRPLRVLEERVKELLRILPNLDDGVMSSQDANDMISRCNRLRQDIINLDKES